MSGNPILKTLAIATSTALLVAALAVPAIAKGNEPSTVGGGTFEFENGNYGTIAVNARPTEAVEEMTETYDGTGRVNVKVYEPDGTLVQHFNGFVTQYTVQTEKKSGLCGEIKVVKGENAKPYFAILVTDNGQPPQPGSTAGDWFKFVRYGGDIRTCPDGAFNAPKRSMTTGNLKVRSGD